MRAAVIKEKYLEGKVDNTDQALWENCEALVAALACECLMNAFE